MLYGVRNTEHKKGGFFHCIVFPEGCVTTRKKNQLNYETGFFVSPISKNITYPGPNIFYSQQMALLWAGIHGTQRAELS